MPHSYTENHLVEQPAIQLFAQLGWQTVTAMEEVLGTPSPQPSPLKGEGVKSKGPLPRGEGRVALGRETKSEVVLLSRLRSALEKLNPTLTPEAISAAIDEICRNRSAMSQAAASREVWELLKDGIKVSVPDRERNGQKIERVQVIDWDSPKENDFLLVSQMTITGPLYTCRPDLVGFVNGLPLVVIELKKPIRTEDHAQGAGQLDLYCDNRPHRAG